MTQIRVAIVIMTVMALSAMAVAQQRGVSRYDPPEMIDWLLKYHLLDVFFLTPKQGWVVGGDGLMLSTHDGGQTWQRTRFGAAKLWSVSFSSPAEGWVVGDRGLLLRSRDGGKTWRREHAPEQGDLRVIRFPTPEVGWMLGRALHRTDNAGRTWKQIALPASAKWNDIACRGDAECILVGDNATIVTTIRGGRSWSQARVPIAGPTDIIHVQIAADGTAWAVAAGLKFGALLRSADMGATWETADREAEGVTRTMFWDADRGLFLGDGILRTVDGGRAWKEVLQSPVLRAVFFVDEVHGWAAGDYRTIWATSDGGLTWRRQHQELRPARRELKPEK